MAEPWLCVFSFRSFPLAFFCFLRLGLHTFIFNQTSVTFPSVHRSFLFRFSFPFLLYIYLFESCKKIGIERNWKENERRRRKRESKDSMGWILSFLYFPCNIIKNTKTIGDAFSFSYFNFIFNKTQIIKA